MRNLYRFVQKEAILMRVEESRAKRPTWTLVKKASEMSTIFFLFYWSDINQQDTTWVNERDCTQEYQTLDFFSEHLIYKLVEEVCTHPKQLVLEIIELNKAKEALVEHDTKCIIAKFAKKSELISDRVQKWNFDYTQTHLSSHWEKDRSPRKESKKFEELFYVLPSCSLPKAVKKCTFSLSWTDSDSFSFERERKRRAKSHLTENLETLETVHKTFLI